jgi:hypothetical protein
MGVSDPGGAGKAKQELAVVREVVRSYTYVGIWMSISIAVILFNKVGLWALLQRCMHFQQLMWLCSPSLPNRSSISKLFTHKNCVCATQWLLAYSGFPFPIALTIWHMGFCSAIGCIAVRVLGLVKSHQMTAREYMTRVMPIGTPHSSWWSGSICSSRRTAQPAVSDRQTAAVWLLLGRTCTSSSWFPAAA